MADYSAFEPDDPTGRAGTPPMGMAPGAIAGAPPAVTPIVTGAPATAPPAERPADPAYAGFERVASDSATPGILESLGRGALSGATFGFEDELGVADRARQDASRQANPVTHFAGEVLGGIAPMAAAAVLPGGQVAAAGRAAGLAARGARLVRSALVPSEIRNVGQAVAQGAKLGATYGALSGAGHAAPAADASIGEAAGQRAAGAVTGGLLGAGAGAGLGAAGYGASRAVGAVLNRTMPSLREVAEAASNPELQGIGDVLRQAGYDKYTMADFVALRDRLRDPAQAHRYQGLNLIEALETRPVTPMAVTGELKPPVAVSPNLRDWAQDVANTGGAGRQEAVQAFAERRNEMAANIAGDVNRVFGQPLSPRASEAEALPGLIDNVFGSGNPAQAAVAQAARKGALGRRYDRMRDKPLVLSEGIGPQIQALPVFQKAMDYAAQNDAIRMPASSIDDLGLWVRNAATGFMERAPPAGQVSAVPGQLWSKNTIGVDSLTLSPNNILDIHHALVMNAKVPPTGVATPETVMAGRLKAWWSAWADKQLKGHQALRTDYARFKQMMEAQDLAGDLSLNRGGPDHPALRFFRAALEQREEAARVLGRHVQQYDAAMARYQAGQIKNPPSPTRLNRGIEAMEAHDDVLGAFRRSWGETIKSELARTADPNSIVRPALTPEGQHRIVAILGPEEGHRFLGSLLTYEARNQGMALGLKAGGSDNAALQFFDRAQREGRTDVVDTFRRAWGDRIRDELASASSPAQVNTVVNALLSQQGKQRILRILGPDAGREFIETLYNKQMQAGLSQTLFGGPDTAYKLARNQKSDALMNAVHGVVHLRPFQVWQATRDIASSAYKQRRADQGNRLLAVQGPENVGRVIDALAGRERLRTSAHPYVLNPALMAMRPFVAASAAGIPTLQRPVQETASGNRRGAIAPYRP